jgi:hypothetical protein
LDCRRCPSDVAVTVVGPDGVVATCPKNGIVALPGIDAVGASSTTHFDVIIPPRAIIVLLL